MRGERLVRAARPPKGREMLGEAIHGFPFLFLIATRTRDRKTRIKLTVRHEEIQNDDD
jgi:hypothetical protein